MPAVMRAAAAIETAGWPAVAIGSRGFTGMGQILARTLGVEGVPIAEYPGVILTDDDDTFDRKVAEALVPQVVAGLTAGGPNAPTRGVHEIDPPASPRDIVFSGTLDEVQEHFLARQWTDGMPIIPPTPDRMERFLQFTDRDANEVIGVLLPEKRAATIWSIAVNGVMAGCRPEYMPVLVAIVECLADPKFRIEDAGSTPGWEPLVTISGPLTAELDFNAGAGVLRVGRQANTTIGRFVRLFMRNVAGLRISPGVTDQGAIASTFNVVLAEDDAAVEELGWQPFRVDEGFALEDTVVSIQSVFASSPPIYSGGGEATAHLETIGTHFGRTIGSWVFLALKHEGWHPLLVMSPSIAGVMAASGFDKDAIRAWLYENVRIPARELEEYAPQVGHVNFSLTRQVADGYAPAEYHESDDPDRLVPQFVRPEWIGIVVAGSSARNQSRAYVSNHGQGVRTTRRVEEPDAWEMLRERRT